MTSSSYHLGIDLGTTYVAAGILRHGRPEIVTLGDRAPVVPSVLFFKEDGEILHGESATRRGLSDPTRVVREFKRRVGDTTPLVVGQTPYSADVLLAKLLRFAHQSVVERQGGRPGSIAVTHPANWGSYKIDVLQQAVRMADIGPITTLTEPVAAAIHYAATERLDVGQTVAVYDLGGGTFDAAVLARTSTGVGFEVRGEVEGIERLGGIDFDEAVFHHAIRWCESAVAELDPDDPAVIQALARLRQECIEAKEALSTDTDVSIPVVLPNLQTEVRLTRAEFEAMIRPLLQQTVEALERAIRNSGVSAEDLAAILLVGGSSRIPLIAEMVGAELGRPIAVDQHPKHTVALGAAIAAGRAAGDAVPTPSEPATAAPSAPASAANEQAPAATPVANAASLAGVPAEKAEPPAARPEPVTLDAGADTSAAVSQLVSIRREGDGPQVVIDRDRTNAGASARANASPAATATAAPAVNAAHAAPPAPAAPMTTPDVQPFDHRQLVSPPSTAGRSPRGLAIAAVVGIVLIALLGAGALILTGGDDGGGDEVVATGDGATEGASDGESSDGEDGSTDPASATSTLDDSATGTTDGAGDDNDTDTDTETTLADDEAVGSTTETTTETTVETTTTATTAQETTEVVDDRLEVTIGSITLDGSTYVVDYSTNFSPVISSDPSTNHLHFFFDTVGVGNAGQPGGGPWILYDGPSPFRGYGTGDRPSGATKLCVTVATHDHAVADASVFQCADLPE